MIPAVMSCSGGCRLTYRDSISGVARLIIRDIAWYCAMCGDSIVRGCSISGDVRIIVDLSTDLIAFSSVYLLSVGGESSGDSVVGVSLSCYMTLLL